MDAQRWNVARRIFEAALELPAQDRGAYLAMACSGDARLLEGVDRMLVADSSRHVLLDGEPPSLEFLGAPAAREADPPPRAGTYRLLEEVGRGGMGVVYRAERADGAFERAVALKLIQGGADSEEVLARFRAERRILAQLEHPNVARLYDAGLTDDGRPFLVMEFVQGTRIDRYCDAERLGVRERARLFLEVCDAVQHAHRSLVIHRDLKPSNVFVRADGSVKLLDFGIAKLTEEAPGDSSKTATGHRRFTPEYASPEQIRGDPLTTSSDVYSLGALLYELLTGRRPFQDWADAAAYALASDGGTAPDTPSQAVTRPLVTRGSDGTTDSVGPEELGMRRTTTPDRWRRALRGDLDRILMKALARAPRDRYSSVEAFSNDLRRHLTGLPVSARPPALSYRLKKFARRHRAGVAASALVVLSVGVGTGVTARQARLAAAEREVALGLSGFLEDLFQASDPRVLQVQDTTRMIDFLDATGDRVRTELEDQPRTRARMLLVLGLTYKNMGRSDRAEPLLREAVQANRRVYGDRHEDLAEAQRLLGLLLSERDNYDEAIPMMEGALATQAALTGDRSWQVGRLHESLGQVFLSAGRLDRAVPHVEASLAIRREVLEPDDPVIANSLNTLAALKSRRGNEREAIRLYEEAIETSLRNADAVPEDVGVQRMNLASVFLRTGRHEEALEQARQGHRILEANIRPWVVARSRGRLAEALAAAWKASGDDALSEEADSLFRSAIDLMRTLPEAMDARYLLHAHARFLQSRAALPEAEAAMREALALAEASMGSDHTEPNRLRADLAAILVDRGRAAEAESLARQARLALAGALSPEHPGTIAATLSLGRALIALGRASEAASLLAGTRDLARASLGRSHPLTLGLEESLAEASEAAAMAERESPGPRR